MHWKKYHIHAGYLLYWWYKHFQMARNDASISCLILAYIIISQTRLQIQKINRTEVQGYTCLIKMK